ncbi:MAG: hypothetical protein M3070_05905 [Actinomycetota bacterium]|nr:hypothetical protein [Actinomycetota bacterium]
MGGTLSAGWSYAGGGCVFIAAVVLCAVLAPAGGPRPVLPTGSSLDNASLEIDAGHDGVPDCWQPEGTGSSEHTSGLTSTAHSGHRGERLTVSSYRSGGQALVMSMSSGCAPPAAARHSYQLGVWYHGHGRMRFVAYYRTDNGTWRFWTHGPWLSPAPGWLSARYATPSTANDTSSVSFGIELRSVGAVTTDDYTLTDAGAAPRSSAPPPAPGYFTDLVPPSAVWRLPARRCDVREAGAQVKLGAAPGQCRAQPHAGRPGSRPPLVRGPPALALGPV